MALDRLTKVDGGGISTTSDYRVGIITASKFVGPFDGTGGNFSGVVTATNGVFSGNISAVDGNFSGNVTIGGTLTYEDVTNIDSVGIITAQKDIHVGAGLSVVGVATFSDHIILKGINPRITFTDTDSNPDFQIFGSGGNLNIWDATNNTSRLLINSDGHIDVGHLDVTNGLSVGGNTTFADDIDVDGHTNLDNVSVAGVTTMSGDLTISSSFPRLKLTDTNNNPDYEIMNADGIFQVTDATNSANRFRIDGNGTVDVPGNLDVGSGIDVTGNANVTGDLDVDGHTNLDNVSVAGVTTTTGNIDANGDLDVDGHTNLDNVSVAGITTFSNGPIVVNGQYYRGIINSGSQEKIVGGYISGSDTLRLGESMYLTSTGLGIGVASPSRKLDVSGDILGNAFMLKGNTSASPSIQAQMYRPENNTLAFATNGNQERLRIKSDGKVLISNTLGLGGATSSPGDLLHAQSPSGEGKIVIIGATTGTVAISGLNGASRVLFGDSSTENAGNITYTHSSDTLSFRINGNTRWKFDSSGHFLPDAVGTYNIGSTSAEVGNVYIADDKRFYAGSDQNLSLHHNNSTGINYLISNPGNMFYMSATNYFTDAAQSKIQAQFIHNSYCELRHAGNLKFRTSETGIDVTGEVAASQDYPNQRPTLDFNFAKTKALDPRLSYTRFGPASYYDERGLLVLVGDDAPRFDHDPMTRESKGILLEESRRNMQPHSIQYGRNGANGWVNIVSAAYVDYYPEVVTPTGDTIGAITFKDIGGTSQHYISTDVVTVSSGTTYTFSFFFKNISGTDANNLKITTSGGNLPYEIRSYYFSGTDIGTSTGDDTTITQLPNGWWRGTYVVTASGNGNAALIFDFHALNNGAAKNNVVAIYGLQCEIGDFPTSYIPTDGNYALRGGDTLTMTGSDLTDVFNEVEGTMFYEASLESLTRDNQAIVAFRDMSNTTVDYHAMGMRIGGGSSGNLRTWFKSNNNNEHLSNHASTGLTPKMFYKHIYGYKDADCADAYRTATNSGIQATGNGSVTGNGTPMITQGLIDELRFGEYYSLGDTYKMDAGHIKRFSYWTQKLTNTQLTTYIS